MPGIRPPLQLIFAEHSVAVEINSDIVTDHSWTIELNRDKNVLRALFEFPLCPVGG